MAYKYFDSARKGILIPAILALAAFFAAVQFSAGLAKFTAKSAASSRYLPSAAYLKTLSAGYAPLVADMFYIRGIMAITDEIVDKDARLRWIQDNFSLAVTLDPSLVEGFFFGGVVIADDNASLKKGIRFLERHRYLAPDDWRLPYWTGFDYFQLGRYLDAARCYQQASVLPQAPAYLKSNQAFIYYKSGSYNAGIMYLQGLLDSLKNPDQAEWINIKLQWLRDIAYLEDAAARFRETYGRLPRDLAELVEVGLIPAIPEDKFGTGYYFDAKTNRVQSSFNRLVKPRFVD